MPLEYWTNACSTSVYLINRLSIPTLNNVSPYFKLFGQHPNYSKLRSFGCLCYPWLKPNNSHKLELKSQPCIFVGYSPTQNAYYCLKLNNNRVYFSRHVHFKENIFPFSKLKNSTSSSSDLVEQWAPLTLSILSNTRSFSSHSLQTNSPSSTPPTLFPTSPLSSPISTTNSSQPPNTTVELSSTPSQSNLDISTSTNSTPNSHVHSPQMTTRLQHGIRKPISKLNLDAEVHEMEIPKNITQAFKNPVWRKAMDEEINALMKKRTWDIVPSFMSQNVVGCK